MSLPVEPRIIISGLEAEYRNRSSYRQLPQNPAFVTLLWALCRAWLIFKFHKAGLMKPNNILAWKFGALFLAILLSGCGGDGGDVDSGGDDDDDGSDRPMSLVVSPQNLELTVDEGSPFP